MHVLALDVLAINVGIVINRLKKGAYCVCIPNPVYIIKEFVLDSQRGFWGECRSLK
jgi:hypothetical protein